MEEEKATAYYDELTRKGGGAARFKQGLGFSSSSTSENDIAPKKRISSSSFLSNFVKASSLDTTSDSNLQKQSQLESIQNKLKRKPTVGKDRDRDYKESERERDRNRSDRDRDKGRDRERDYRDRDRDEDRYRERNYRDRDRERNEERKRGKRRRSPSPWRERRGVENMEKERKGKVDYSRLIKGYDRMTPAERVKAKMKLQLAETAEKDDAKASGWERFEFNKDAPLDDEEIEAAEDDAALVKHIEQSFRFSAIEARREEQIKAAHDKAMFGASAVPLSVSSDSEPEPDNDEKKCNDRALATNLFSETVLARQQGSWRDRARKA